MDTVLFQKTECCFLVMNLNIVAPNFLHHYWLFQIFLKSALHEFAFLHLSGVFLEMRSFIPLSTVRIWV